MKLSATDIVGKIKVGLPDVAFEWVEPENGDKYAFVPADKIDAVVSFLKSDKTLSFDYLMNLSAFDAKEHIEVTYHLYSYLHRHSFTLKVKAVRLNGAVNTLCALYGAANYQEREVFDHFGVKFTGHPDMRRILLPDDWVGYPLLKDYTEQEDYNGIGTTRPSLL